LARECSLIKQLLGSGVTALGKASYADGEGNYYVAFFGISVGMERLAKLILVADYALTHSGNLPQEKEIKKFGHHIADLLERVDKISKTRALSLSYPRPVDEISKSIVVCLDSFADAGRGRYANFQAIGDPNFSKQFEPISNWWRSVAEPILTRHYRGSARELKVNKNAELAERLMGSVSLVLHRNETGEIMQDVRTASARTGQTYVVQRYARYYTLRLIRWMADVFSCLSRDGGYKHGLEVLFGHYEHFFTFVVEDEFLRTRKVWPL
jgi:hypothetical protein